MWLLIFLLPCTLSISPTPTNPPHSCANFGLCSYNPGPTVNQTYITCPSGKCICQPGTTGPDCEIVDDQCADDPCGGSQFICTTGIGTHKCECDYGLTGKNCDIVLDTVCADEPCFNGAKCISNDSLQFSCQCKDGYQGDLCKYKDICKQIQCVQGGICESLWEGANFRCNCPPYWTGRACGWATTAYVPNSQVLIGCFGNTGVLNDQSKFLLLFTDNQMSLTKCRKAMEDKKDYTYTYYAVSGTNCFISKGNYLNETEPIRDNNDENCKKECPGDRNERCGKTGGYESSRRLYLYRYNETKGDFDYCAASNASLCGADEDRGVCVDLHVDSGSNYTCICKPPYTGDNCEIDPGLPCDPDPCQNNGTCIEVRDSFRCDCLSPYIGDTCEYLPVCTSKKCLYGGTCFENNDGTFKCECLPLYKGDTCSDINICEYADPCVHGKCENKGSGIEITYKCNCEAGFTGKNCDTEINMCLPKPCQNGGTCVPKFNDYECICVIGTDQKSCEHIIPLCVPYKDQDTGQWVQNPCTKRDPGAICNNLINDFSCNCTEKWTGDLCTLNIVIRDVLMTIYGEINLLMIPMLEDLMKSPAMIKDMVPFIIGTLEYENRTRLSWAYEDLFVWAAFEEKVLDTKRDLLCWNDVVLGNCFSFNHYETESSFLMRSSGEEGGFRTLMRVRQDEFQPWFETAAIMVFVHNRDEYIFSESVRYNAEPNGEMNLYVKDSRYTRLDGNYGVCVYNPSEVDAYYYDGMYTTDGCLRSCYQDMIFDSCGCMDPRYPMPAEVTTCKVVDMPCIDEATALEGDPSTWENCVCPLPCANQQYSVQWTKSTNADSYKCVNGSGCIVDNEDAVLISITLAHLEYYTYAETVKMDFNRFISNLGGLLAALMGVCIITFIEFVILILIICNICIRGVK